MKKLLFIIMIVAFVLGITHTNIGEVKNDNTSPNVELTDNLENLPNGSITITAVGDCTLATDVNYSGSGSFVNEVRNQNNDYSYFFKNVRKYFESDDLTIINFEGTLSENGSRAEKQFSFRGEPDFVNILSSSSVEAANLANNHTKDYGMVALSDTKEILSNNNIANFEGTDVVVYKANGISVGLIGINALNETHRGYFDDALSAIKSQGVDLIIVSFHWGVERSDMPNSLQIELAHKAIDNGADLVIGHHPHVLQGIEKYNGKYILYSLGNFCFGGNKNPSDKDTMIFRQTFTFENGTVMDDDNYSIIPCSISSTSSRNNYQPTPLTSNEYERVKSKIISRTNKINDIELNFE